MTSGPSTLKKDQIREDAPGPETEQGIRYVRQPRRLCHNDRRIRYQGGSVMYRKLRTYSSCDAISSAAEPRK